MPNWKDLLSDRIKAPVGHEFFVGGSGASDSKSGQIATEPFEKIATALAHCVDGRHDVIWVQDYWANDTFPIVYNKQCVHIIGLMTKQPGGWPMMNPGAYPCFQIGTTGGYGEISGLIMGADATHPCIEITAGGNTRMWIHNCSFGEHIVAQDGIISEIGTELVWSIIEDNVFGKALVRDGLRIYSPSWTDIKNNRFSEYGGIGINYYGDNAAARGGWLIGNRFFKAIGAAAGWAITLNAIQMTKLDDNRAMESGVAPQNNPYKDTSSGVAGTTKNAWGVNWSGGLTIMPDAA